MTDTDVLDLPESLRAHFQRSGVALALSSDDDEVPLVLVNDAFCRMTGYEPSEVVGRNCRFLQGERTTAEQKQALHDFIHDDGMDGDRFQVLNYRKDGTTFLNFVFMTRLRDRAGETRYILASQFDMTEVDRRMRLGSNDDELGARLSDIEGVGREYGLAMVGSAQILADSAAMLARLSIDEDWS